MSLIINLITALSFLERSPSQKDRGSLLSAMEVQSAKCTNLYNLTSMLFSDLLLAATLLELELLLQANIIYSLFQAWAF